MWPRVGLWRWTLSGLTSAARWANENPGPIALGGGAFTALSGGAYGGFTLYDAASSVASERDAAQRSCGDGRAAYVRGDTATATARMESARRSTEAALQRARSCWAAPAVVYRIAGTSHAQMCHLMAHVYYHCAVLCIRNAMFDDALQMLGMSMQQRAEAVAGEGMPSVTAAEGTRCKTRQGDIRSWDSVSSAMKMYSNIIEGDEGGETFFTVCAHNNFGVLWYALGYDQRSAACFRKAASVADKLSKLNDAQSLALEQSPQALSHLSELGRSREVAALDPALKSILDAASTLYGIVDVAHLPPASSAARDLEAAERLKLTWRKRVTARVNLLHVLTTTWPPCNSRDILEVLAQLQVPVSPHSRAPNELFNAPYLALDNRWLAHGGSVRIAFAVIAGLTNLLVSGSLPPTQAVEARRVLLRAADLGVTRLADASSTHQGLFEYHYAAFLLHDGNPEKAARHITMATVNHDSNGATHLTQRDVRLRLEAVLLRNPPPTREDVEKALSARDGAVSHRPRDITRRNPDHPLLLRLQECTAARGVSERVSAPAITAVEAADLLKGLDLLIASMEGIGAP